MALSIQPTTESLLETVSESSARLSQLVESAQPWRLGETELLEGVQAAYRLAAQAHAVALVLLGEVDARDVGVAQGASSTQGWLAATRRLRPAEARRDLTLARLIRKAEVPVTGFDPSASDEGSTLRSALANGDVTVDQAGCVATALAELPPEADVSTRVLAERLLVDEAAVQAPAALTRLGHRILERVDPDAADRKLAETLAREEREANRVRSGSRFTDGHGSVFYRFRVPVGDDAVIWPVLDTLAAPQSADMGTGEPDRRSAHQRLADAFVEAMRRVGLEGGLPSRGGDRPRAVVTVDLESLRSGLGSGRLLDTGDQLSIEAIRRLACDASVIPIVLNGDGQLLDVGRSRRTFDGPLRLAVITRDQGCIHPGCTRPARWCDVHHVLAWWAGGRTSLDNGVLLCGHHHKLYDAGTWTIRFADDGIPEAIPPPWIDPTQLPRRHERFLERRRL